MHPVMIIRFAKKYLRMYFYAKLMDIKENEVKKVINAYGVRFT